LRVGDVVDDLGRAELGQPPTAFNGCGDCRDLRPAAAASSVTWWPTPPDAPVSKTRCPVAGIALVWLRSR